MKSLEVRREAARESMQERADVALDEFVKILMDSDENEILKYTDQDIAELMVEEIKRGYRIK